MRINRLAPAIGIAGAVFGCGTTPRIRHAVVAFAFAGLLAAAGCAERCPTETPQVSELPASCTERPGEPVSFPVRLCPTCNQTGATCDVDLSAVGTSSDIFLDPRVEVCTGSATCPPACELNTLACTFTAPVTSVVPRR